jgi:hypothetical protein
MDRPNAMFDSCFLTAGCTVRFALYARAGSSTGVGLSGEPSTSFIRLIAIIHITIQQQAAARENRTISTHGNQATGDWHAICGESSALSATVSATSKDGESP